VSDCNDTDLDGFGPGCAPGPDCDNNNHDIYPGAPELCDYVDNQCPGDPGYGTVDEGCGTCDLAGLDLVPVAALPGGVIALSEGASQNFTAVCTYLEGFGGCGGITSDNCALAGGVNWLYSGQVSLSTPGPSTSTVATAGQIPGPNGGAGQVSGQATYGAGSFSDSTNIVVLNNDVVSSVDVTPDTAILAEGGAQDFAALATWSDGYTRQMACDPGCVWTCTDDLTLAGCAGNLRTVEANQIPCGNGGSGACNITCGGVSDPSASAITITNDDSVAAVSVTPDSATLAEGGSALFKALATWTDGCTLPVACDEATTWTITGDLTAGECESNQLTVTANQIPCGAGRSEEHTSELQSLS
jgi:hypothetical protein